MGCGSLAFGLALSLAGCGDLIPHPGLVGRMIDTRPPPGQVTEGGPSGALLGGPVPDVPDADVDKVVAAGLTQWLTAEERRSLAAASERAAVAPASAAIDWQAHDGGDAVTATGSALAVGEVYRSLRGRICRDVRQSFDKDGKTQAETVALCRDGAALWITSAD